MTKVDVLDQFDELCAATAYQTDEGETNELPYDLSNNCPTPVYKTYPGWQTDTTKARQFADFPAPLQQYVQEMEEALGVPFSIISVGPGRDQLVLREAKTVVA